MLNKEQLYNKWWNAPTESEQLMEESHRTFWNKIIDKILEKEKINDFSVLDFGCNQGGFLRYLYSQYPFREGVGTDLGKESIQVANERKGDLPLQYEATASPEQWGHRFDLAVSTAVIYLISDLQEHAYKIKAALKPGGVYYASYSDYSKNPSLPYMREKIDSNSMLPMNLHALDDIASAFFSEGFEVGITRLIPDMYVQLSNKERFFINVRDRIQYEYEEAYLFRFVAPI